MAGQYETAITISAAIKKIDRNEFKLPAIQRKFVWTSQQICVLFDSIMRGYPINSFMVWTVEDGDIKNNFKFYGFLRRYCQRFEEENPHTPTNANSDDFMAVIDGQQRLTSLYIGLNGSYAYKKPRIHWPKAPDTDSLPPRQLYLDLLAEKVPEEDDNLMLYNFKFLTDDQYRQQQAAGEHHWFRVGDVLKMPPLGAGKQDCKEVVLPYLADYGLESNDFAQNALGQLYDVIINQPLIHYFNEREQQIDHVLDVFIRTNSGGTKLEFSDLLMSIAVANWKGDFREEMEQLMKSIHLNDDMGFYIERDWILKACLMLTGADVRFMVKNFKADQVAVIQREWEELKACIKASFRLVRGFGINPQSLTSKNAVIPIAYYLYKKQWQGEPLYHVINNLVRVPEERAAISQWFYLALLKGVFGGQADTILNSMRDVLDKHLQEEGFPLEAIIEHYKGDRKDLRFDDEQIENLLDIEHGEGRCRALLHLMFPEMKETIEYQIDHIHAWSLFEPKKLKAHAFLVEDDELMAFYADRRHWNSMANLHLLNSSQNGSKNDKLLVDWLAEASVHITPRDLLVEGVSLEFRDFKAFYEHRRAALKSRLLSRLPKVASIQAAAVSEDDEEEARGEEVIA